LSTLFEKLPTIKEVLITNTEKSKALEDPIRVAIIDMLSHDPMSVQEIVNELKKKKINKAITSIRHHIDILKDSGLIELVKMEEAKGGGTLKYYASNTKLLNFNTPKDFETKFKPAIEDTTNGLMKMIAQLARTYNKKLTKMAEALKPCPYCNTQHFVEFLLLNILCRATVEAIKKKEFSDIIKTVSNEIDCH
jgi:DNA-binding transcriptional ArsR family regulator